jgi:biofilm PGA synthesis lipoprotein PgaB
MTRIGLLGAVILSLPFVPVDGSARNNEFQVIAYHDVRDYVLDEIDADQYAISASKLIDHFNWLRLNGFVPISVDDLIRAQNGASELPDRAVLLTFDDGFKSVYTHVFPLLKLFNYPAVVSIVTSWTNRDTSPGSDDPYVLQHEFLSWQDIREMRESGLVEVASHSHNLHRGIRANPQGNTQPAAVARLYHDGRYETHGEFAKRIRNDLTRSAALIEEHTGRAPRVMTWPYGAYSEDTLEIARNVGMPITLTLDSDTNSLDRIGTISRHLVLANPGVRQLSVDLLHPNPPPLIRAAQVDLDYVYDPDPQQREANLGRLLDRIKALEISHVFLQAFADPDGDGGAQALYFPNRHLPMRADLFNRVAWQLKTRSNVLVYGWLPILSYEGDGIDPAARVTQLKNGELSFDAQSEPRLSVFDANARRVIEEIYEDLAVHAPIDGILFHDDGRLNEFEDANPAAVAAYRKELGRAFSVAETQSDAALSLDWARFKSRAINDFTLSLARTVKRYRPGILTVRNLFSATLTHPDGEIFLAQNFDDFLEDYDYVALMAMPYFENAPDPRRFYEQLVAAVGSREHGFDRTIFEIQTVDWRSGKPVPAAELRRTMRWLQSRGVKHLGYYPDDFIEGQPLLHELRRGMSLARFPQEAP